MKSVIPSGLVILAILMAPHEARSADCNQAEITLTTQAEVDSFQADYGPGCDTVTNGLTIDGDTITDLTPLAGLKAVATVGPWGYFTHRMIITNTSLTSLAGLESLADVWWIGLINNSSVNSISALSSLTTVRGPIQVAANAALTNLDGLEGVTALTGGALIIEDNPLLSNLDGVSNISTINASLVLKNNDSLTHVDGLAGLTHVNSNMNISYNDGLLNLDGLANIANFSATFDLRFNSKLESIPVFTGWTDLNGLILYYNAKLEHIDGLLGVETIGNNYSETWIKNNASLTHLDGLANLVSIDAGLDVSGNPALGDCDGLATVLDLTDDGLPGPGPGDAGIPDIRLDVVIENNLPGCNSIMEITGESPPPPYDLEPDLGGLDNHFGAFSQVNPDDSCDWEPGETVEFWWDDPEILLGSVEVDEGGCFQALVHVDSEKVTGAAVDTHVIEARGTTSGTSSQNYKLVEPQLILAPSSGASGSEVDITGCNWDGAGTVNLTWLDESIDLGTLDVDVFGCLDTFIKLPKVKGGIFSIVGESDTALVSQTAFQVKIPEVSLFPPESPPGAKIVVAGCNWFADEIVEFEFQGEDGVFSLVDTGGNGCLTNKLGGAPFIEIPGNATLGEKTLSARGQTSDLVVNQLFVVREPTLSFTPDTGLIGDPIIVSGCGWAENETVTVTWGHNDHNNQPIKWDANVDLTTGCFGQDAELVINIPQGSNTGPIEVTAEGGDVSSQAMATLSVDHNGIFFAPNPDAYAGYAVTLKFETSVVPEQIGVQTAGNPTTLQYVTATTEEFTFDFVLPTNLNVGNDRSLSATGSKGFQASTKINILDNAEISVFDPGTVKTGRPLKVEGQNWGSYEDVQFKLIQGTDEIFLSPTAEVPAGEIGFTHYLDMPSSIPSGEYTLLASGNKGRDAELAIKIDIGLPAVFTLGAAYANTPPVLDGRLSRDEWNYSQKVDLPNGFITARSDESRLYILLDLLGDTGEDPLGTDNFWLSFDVFKDQDIDANWDLNFRMDNSGEMVLEKYTGPNSFSTVTSNSLRSAVAPGFGCFVADGTNTITGTIPPVLNCDSHRVYEIAIDLETILAEPGELVRVGVRMLSQSPSFADVVPEDFEVDFTNLGSIRLADSRLGASPPDGKVNGFGEGGFEVEVTQAIQDVDNSLSLVTGKKTAVRIYPDVAAESMVRTLLFGKQSGQKLPGSPLVSLSTVPENIDREQFDHTVNFLLPESWTSTGYIDLTVEIENLDGSNLEVTTEQVYFTERKPLEIWVFPFNVGDSDTPVLPQRPDMVEQQKILEELIPTPDVYFLRKPWTDVLHSLQTANCPDLNTIGNNDDALDPGETLTCTKLKVVTQSDIGTDKKKNYRLGAIAAADGGDIITGMVSMTIDGPEPPPESVAAAGSGTHRKVKPENVSLAEANGGTGGTPRLRIAISSDVADYDKPGDPIIFSFDITNPGTAPTPGPVIVADSESAMTLGEMKQFLNIRWNTEVQAREMSANTAPMPDALYGFKVFSDQSTIGSSNPTWLSPGRGHVVVGQADGRNVNTTTMVHELNHNLDKSASGTFGRHVGDPDDDDNNDWGCGAGGVDPVWPYDGNSEIQEVGFNTALPWAPAAGDLTIIPADRDDYQSYCRAGSRPVQWISPYRWTWTFSSMNPLSITAQKVTNGPEYVIYISGELQASGPGMLNPVTVMPGTVETAMVSGDWSIELQDAFDTVLYSMPFAVSFTDVEGEPIDMVPFFFRLPDQANLHQVVLKHNDTELHSISLSANAPALQITSPAGGESWSGEETIQWSAEDLDSDPLTFSIFYSPDDGANWQPVASGLSGSEYTFDSGRLPGGSEGKIMLVATDGLHTATALSSGNFGVPEPDPIVSIDSPANDLIAGPDDRLELTGTASMPDGSGDALSLAWLIDGELVATGTDAFVHLGQGLHEITLMAFGPDGNLGEDSVTVQIERNDPPNRPIQPSPEHGETRVLRDITLSWLGGDIDADEVEYDVYLSAGNVNPTDLVCDDVLVSECQPAGLLDTDTQYYWRVVASDEEGEVAESDTWWFHTGQFDSSEVIHEDGFE